MSERLLVAGLVAVCALLGAAYFSWSLDRSFAHITTRIERTGH